MVFPDYAPLDHILPRYLSAALLRRLNTRSIKTIGHSSLRWVGRSSQPVLPPPPPSPPAVGSPESVPEGPASTADGSIGGEANAALSDPPSFQQHPPPLVLQAEAKRQQQRLQVMTAHSFDHLDTAIHSADRVVLAGADVAPLSVTVDLHGRASVNADGEREGAVARRKRAGTLEVDARRGAVVVNAELAASSRVWAAGDVACFPSQLHGGRRLVLRSVDHAHHSGQVAGENMGAAGAAATASLSRGGEGAVRYCHSPAFIGEAPLAGVRVAMVGDCNAGLPTHGFWWTNTSTGLSRKATASERHSTARPPKEQSKQASGVSLRTRRTVRKDFTPVFGTGVVFYTSGAEVRGAMLWGFPGEATAAAAMRLNGSPVELGGVEGRPADAAAGISARAVDLLRHIMKRSTNMEADLSDERVMQAWVQGLSDAAQEVAKETGLGHLQPTRR